MENNPLSTYFRKEKLKISLPSKGNYYPVESLQLNPENLYTVHSMSSMDEYMYQAPNANNDGTIIKKIIEKCIPDIKNAWDVPSIDLDIIMIAIRVASYGNILSLKSICPNCETDNVTKYDLNNVLNNIKFSSYDQPYNVDNITIWLQPVPYKISCKELFDHQEEEKILQNINIDESSSAENIQKLQNLYEKIFNLTVKILAHNIKEINVDNITVTNYEQIEDWLKNCETQVFNSVKNAILEKKNINSVKDINMSCKNCNHNYNLEFYLDQTNFTK